MDMPAITLPAAVTDTIQSWSTESPVLDLSDKLGVVKETWDLQTFSELQEGKVAVPDEVINDTLAKAIDDSERVKELKIESLENHQLKITAVTAKSGKIEMLCQVEKFEHDKDHSVVKLKAMSKKLPERPMMSWIFSRISLSLATKLVGHIDPGKGLNMEFNGNEITVDFHQALYQSAAGSVELFGYRPLDYLTVYSATPNKGYVEFQTNMALPDNIKEIIQNSLQLAQNS